MKHKSLKLTMKEAEEIWEREHHADDIKLKPSFLLGWLKISYDTMYNDLPDFKKEEKESSIPPAEYVKKDKLWKQLMKQPHETKI